MTPCDREQHVHAYHDRQLGLAAREAFEDHLAVCPACAQLLSELRAVSQLIVSTPLPDVQDPSSERYYDAWDIVASRRRGLLRISSWMTAAAAAVLVGALVLLPARQQSPTDPAVTVAVADAEWETAALMPPPATRFERPDQFVELAQWMANDLSDGGGFQQR